MKSDPASSPDENLPLRRKSADSGKSGAEPGEADLWDLDEDGELKPYVTAPKQKERPVIIEAEKRPDDEPGPTAIPISPRGARRDNPPFNPGGEKKKFTPGLKIVPEKPASPEAEKLDPAPAKEVPPVTLADESVVLAPASPVPAAESKGPIPSDPSGKRNLRKIDDPFDDLEPGDELPVPVPASVTPEPAKETPATEYDFDAPAPERISIVPNTPSKKETVAPVVNPSMSSIEKIGLIAFIVLLLGGGVFFMIHSINKLPEKQVGLTESDFPIKGKLIEALKVTTYWRPPITSGPNADTFRRGTELLPVLEIETSSGPAALRIFFKNEAGTLVGDGITRPVNGKTRLTLVATAGFEDLGMHAAYRAGNAEKWTVEVLEAPSINATGSEFKPLFELPISTERR